MSPNDQTISYFLIIWSTMWIDLQNIIKVWSHSFTESIPRYQERRGGDNRRNTFAAITMIFPAAGQLLHDCGKVARVVQTGWSILHFLHFELLLFRCGSSGCGRQRKTTQRSKGEDSFKKETRVNVLLSSGTLTVSTSCKAIGSPCPSQKSSMCPNLKELTLGLCQKNTWRRRHKVKRQRIDIRGTELALNQLKKREPQVRRSLKKSLTDVGVGEVLKLFVFVDKN